MENQVCIYQTGPDEFVVSCNEVWVPGVYLDAEAAKRAVAFKDEELLALQARKNPDGKITMEDLAGLSTESALVEDTG